jgi:hypothetical protein
MCTDVATTWWSVRPVLTANLQVPGIEGRNLLATVRARM